MLYIFSIGQDWQKYYPNNGTTNTEIQDLKISKLTLNLYTPSDPFPQLKIPRLLPHNSPTLIPNPLHINRDLTLEIIRGYKRRNIRIDGDGDERGEGCSS